MRRLLVGVLGMVLAAAANAAAPAADSARALWPRIAEGLRMGDAQRPEVRRFISHYAANPQALATMLARAEPYLWFIVESAELRELPMELALLPAVESGYNAHARSVAAATGLWQFIPGTGQAYGLKETTAYDGRRDPVASTRAALAHLRDLHLEFRDWRLALAGYNAGAGRVREAIRRDGTRDFWKMRLPPQTREYVPRLLALAAIVRSPEKYGVRLPAFSDTPRTELVALGGDLSLPAALRAAKVDHAVLRRYNPGIKRITARPENPTLMLPAADALVLRAELAQAALGRPAAALAAPVPVRNRPSPAPQAVAKPDPLGLRSGGLPLQLSARLGRDRHTVQPGETLFAIARQHGLSVAQLQDRNALHPSAVLSAGQTLQLPAAGGG